MSKSDLVLVLCLTITRMTSLPSQRDVTSSVLSRSSPVPVNKHTEGYHVPYSLFNDILLFYAILYVAAYQEVSPSKFPYTFLISPIAVT